VQISRGVLADSLSRPGGEEEGARGEGAEVLKSGVEVKRGDGGRESEGRDH